jgi:hypothetical protein
LQLDPQLCVLSPERVVQLFKSYRIATRVAKTWILYSHFNSRLVNQLPFNRRQSYASSSIRVSVNKILFVQNLTGLKFLAGIQQVLRGRSLTLKQEYIYKSTCIA